MRAVRWSNYRRGWWMRRKWSAALFRGNLHDQVGQTLNAVLVEAANLAKRIQADDAVSLRYLDNIRKFADSSVNSIRDIALLLRPSMLDDLGLIPALEWQAREVSRRSGIKIKCHSRKCVGFTCPTKCAPVFTVWCRRRFTMCPVTPGRRAPWSRCARTTAHCF